MDERDPQKTGDLGKNNLDPSADVQKPETSEVKLTSLAEEKAKEPAVETTPNQPEIDASLSDPKKASEIEIDTTDIRKQKPASDGGFLSLAQAAQMTGYHQDYLGQLARAGKLPAQKIGRNWVTTIEAVYKLKQGLDASVGTNMVSEATEQIGEVESVKITAQDLDKIKEQLDVVKSKMSEHETKISEHENLVQMHDEKIVEHEEKFVPKEEPIVEAIVRPVNLQIAHHHAKDFVQHEVPNQVFPDAQKVGFIKHIVHMPKYALAILLLSVATAAASTAIYFSNEGILGNTKNLTSNYLPQGNLIGQVAAATQTNSVPQTITNIIYKIINTGGGTVGPKGDTGPVGPQGPAGPPGTGTTNVTYIMPTSPGSTPGSIAGFTYLSSKDFITETAKVTTLIFSDGTTMTTAATGSGSGVFTSDVTINGQSDLRFGDADSSNWVAFQAPAVVGANVTWTLPDADSSGCFQSDGAGNITIGSCGGGSGALSGLSAAIGPNTLNNGDEEQVWNWTLSTATKSAFTFGENVASTNGVASQFILEAGTLSGSTATPLYVRNLGNAISFRVDDVAGDATPFTIDASGNVSVGGTLAFTDLGSTDSNSILCLNSLNRLAGCSTLTDAQISDTLTSSNFIGSGSTTNAVDLATAEVSGTLAVGNGGTGAATLNNLITLTTHTQGNYVATITNGSGISGSSSTEGGTPTIALGPLTSDWDQTGAFDITLNNASSELKILESAGATFYGILDVTDLSAADKTYTFPNANGTVITTGNIVDIAGLTDAQISDTLTASNFVGSGSTTNAVDLATAEVSGTLAVGNGGTGAVTLNDLITLGTHTQGAYVATITAGNGLTGDVSSEGSTPTLAVGAGTAITVNANDVAVTADGITDTQLAFNTGQHLTTTSNVQFATLTVDNSGIHILDTNASHDLVLAVGSNITADRTLTITTGDADRTLTLSGDTTLSGTNTGDVTLAGHNYLTLAGQVITANDVALTTHTSGNYVATITAGGGLTGDVSSEGSTPTLAVGAGSGITVNANDIVVDQSFGFSWLNNHSWTKTITDDGTLGTFAVTLGNDGNPDTVNALKVSATSANTSDADILYGINIDNLASADGTVLERALRIGSGWDQAIDVNGTLISLSELQVLDGGIALGTETTGNYVADITGTANQISVSAATGSVTLSIPSDFRAPGTLNAVTSIATGAGAGTVRIDSSGVGTFASGTVVGSQTFTTNTITDSGNLTIAANGSSTGNVVIGGASSTTPDLLVVGRKSDAGNPTAVDGAIYYNANAGKLYIAEGSAWKEVCNKTDAACGAGSGSAWSALADPAGNLSLSMAENTTTFTWDTASTAATKDYFTLSVTNDGSTDVNTQRLLILQNNDTTGSTATERLLVLSNADTDEAVTTALEISSAAGAVTTALDVSDSDIGTAISFGANDISGTNFSVTGSSGVITSASLAGGGTLCLQTNNSGVISAAAAACGAGGSGDNISVNNSAAVDANFLNVAATGSVAGTTWTLVGASTPDDITLAISVASGSIAGVVDTNSQTFAGAKTLTSNLTINKADSSIVFNTASATDTDFWIGVQDDAGTDDDDFFEIGDGTTPGTNPFLTINTSGQVGIGTSAQTTLLSIVNGGQEIHFDPNTGAGLNIFDSISASFAIRVNGATHLLVNTAGASIYGADPNTFAVGPNGTINPSFNVDTSAASAETGINISSAAAGGGVFVGVLSSGTNESLGISAKGSGTITLALGSTGDIQFFSSSNKITSAGALTLASSITSTSGNVAISAGNLTLGGGTTRIANNGTGTFISGTVIGSQTFTTNNIVDSGALTIKSATGANALTLDSGSTGTVNLGTSNNAKTINVATGTAGNTINIATDNTTKDTVNIGSVLDDVAITGDQWSVTNAGVGTFASATVIGSQTFTTNNIVDSGALTIKSATGANALTLDSGSTGTVNLGTSNNAKTINVATGTAGNTINIATDNTTKDTVNIGSVLDDVAITGDQWSVTNAGVGTFASATVIGSQTFTTNNIVDSGALTIKSATGANALTLDSGSTGTVNLGTSNNAKTINVATGTAGNTINIATDNTTKDTVNIGSVLDDVAITGDQWSVTNAGVLTVVSCSGCGGGGGALDTLTAATSDDAALLSGDNTIEWSWALTSATSKAFTISESTAGTSGAGDQHLLKLSTLSTSTAGPLEIISNSADGGDIEFNLASAGDFDIKDNGTTFASFNDNGSISFAPSAGQGLTLAPVAATTGTPTLLTVTGPAHTTLTASAEAIDINLNLARTVQFATGALATQRAINIAAPTYGFVGGSTITNAATLAISGAPVKGTNATITNTHALLIASGAVSTATNSYGLTVNAQTGATNNYAAQFIGGQTLFATGSGSLPGIAGGGDPDTGIELGSDIIDFSIGGATRMSIQNLDLYVPNSVHFQGDISQGFTSNNGNDIFAIFTSDTDRLLIDATGDITMTQGVSATGSPTALTLTGAAHTTLTASTEATDVNFNLARTVQFSTGALATQRALRIQAPTYGFVGASTLTEASTVAISGAPIAGTNATITNAYALNVESGNVKVTDGNIKQTIAAFNPTTLGGADTGAGTAVEVQGKYAYTAANSTVAGTCSGTTVTGCEFRIYDIHNPSSPVAISGIDPTATGNPTFIKVSGRYAYVTLNGGATSKVRIYDISNPSSISSPADISLNEVPTGGLFIAGKYLYVGLQTIAGTCDTVTATGCEFRVYDISNPANPTFVGGVDTGESVFSVQVAGKYVYLTNQADAGGTCSGATIDACEIRIYDISNPNVPTAVGGFNTDNAGYYTFPSGRYLYFTQATNSGTCSGTTVTGCEFGILDISNPGTPTGIRGVNVARDTFSAVVSGKYVYVGSAANAGTCSGATVTGCEVAIYDISDPVTAITAVGGVNTTVDTGSIVLNGKYVHLGLSTVSGNDWRIIDTAGIDTPSASIGTVASNNIQISEDANIAGNLYVGNSLQVGTEGIYSYGPVAIKGNTQGQVLNMVQGVATTGSPTGFSFTGAAHTSLTASTEAIDMSFALNRTVQFATGSLTTQRAINIAAPTYAFVGASTLTDAVTMNISGAPARGSNATITNSHALRIEGGSVTSNTTNAYGLSVAAPTGATNNYAAQFTGGNVGIGDATPTSRLTVTDGSIQNKITAFNPTTLGGADLGGNSDSNAVQGKYAYTTEYGPVAGTCSGATVTGCEFRIYDITNPSSPVAITGLNIAGSIQVVKVSGSYVYFVSQNGGSSALYIYDISNPSSPSSVSTTTLNADPYSMNISGKYLFLGHSAIAGTCNSTTVTGCEFRIYDISNPVSPSFVGGLDTGGDTVISIYPAGKYVYFATSTNAGTCSGATVTGCEIKVHDISNPANPTAVGGFDTGIAVNHITISGRYLFFGQGVNGGTCSGTTVTGCEFGILDISNPAAPAGVRGVNTGLNTWSASVSGKYAYVGNAVIAGTCSGTTATGCELRTYDISDPVTAVTFVGGLDLTVAVNWVAVAGKYVHLSLDSVSGNDWRIIDVAGVDTPSASIGTVASNSIQISEDAYIGNNLSVGSGLQVGIRGITSYGQVSVLGSTTDSGVNAIAGIYGVYTLTNSTASGFQFGNRFLTTVNGGTAGTHVGTFIRMTDDTSLSTGQVVRGLEVQAYSGTNNNGVNTGIASFGKTFGIHAETTAQAGAVSVPAALFADLNNSSDGSLGNAIRAYSNDVTSASLVSFYQETTTFTGNGLIMDFANNSGAFTGNFVDFKKAGTSRLVIDHAGNTTWTQGVATTGSPTLLTATGAAHTTLTASTEATDINFNLNRTVQFATGALTDQRAFRIQAPTYGFVGSSTLTNASTVYIDSAPITGTNATITNSYALFVDSGAVRLDGTAVGGGISVALGSTASTTAVCSSLALATGPTATVAYELRDCNGSPAADYSEMYPVSPDVDEGDLVMATQTTVVTKQGDNVSILAKADTSVGNPVIGVVSRSTDVTDFNTIGYNIEENDNPKPIALNGRVLVKVTEENGPVEIGDRLTLSHTLPGYAMKQIESGESIGTALEKSTSGAGKMMVFLNLGYHPMTVAQNDAGQITIATGDYDMNGFALQNVKSITSISGKWSIDENGNLVVETIKAKQLCLEDVCIDKTQLQNLLQEQSASIEQTPPVESETSPASDPIIDEPDENIETEPSTPTVEEPDTSDIEEVDHEQVVPEPDVPENPEVTEPIIP